MAETERFEARLRVALEAYADEVPTAVDAAELTRSIATAERARGWRRLFPGEALEAWSGTARVVRLALILGALVLLAVALVVLAQRPAPAPLPSTITGRMSCTGSPWTGPSTERIELDCATELADGRASGAAHLSLDAPTRAGSALLRAGSMQVRTLAGAWSGVLQLESAPNGVTRADASLAGQGVGLADLVLDLRLTSADGLRWGVSGTIAVTG